ncbi:hypothetical protein Tco_0039943 [Tanacetum coccineum]
MKSSPSPQVTDTQPAEKPWAIVDAIQSIDAFKSAEEIRNQPKTADAKKIQESIVEEEVIESGIKSLGDVPLDQFGEADANLDVNESLFDTESEIKFIGKEVPKSIYNGSQFNEDATQGTVFSISDQVMQEADSDLESMPGDEIESLYGFEEPETNDDTISVRPLGHHQANFSSLVASIQNLESSLSKKVADKIKESFPRMVVNALEERLPKMLFDTLKTILPDLLQDSMNKALPRLNKHVKKTIKA